MKRLTTSLLSTLILGVSLSSGAIAAQPPSGDSNPSDLNNRTVDTSQIIRPTPNRSTPTMAGISTQRSSAFQANPAQLVALAERGYLENQSIPSGNALSSAYDFGHLTATDVVKAAIAAGRISPDRLNDGGYLAAVDDFLRDLSDHSNGSS